jgi:hypothetical protein
MRNGFGIRRRVRVMFAALAARTAADGLREEVAAMPSPEDIAAGLVSLAC